MIYSGLDWSENVGAPVGYMAMVHVDGDDLTTLEDELAAARKRLGYELGHPFKHVESKPLAHQHFYRALAAVPSLTAHIYEYSRLGWAPRYARPTLGDPCVCDAFITLTLRCPRHLVEQQTLYIDLPRRERDIVVAFATALRNAMKGSRQRSFGKIKPRPDDRLEGGIVQVADMIAGEAKEYSGIGGQYLTGLGSRIYLVD